MVHPYATENIWFDKSKVLEAESKFYARKYAGLGQASASSATPSLVSDIQNIKDHIRSTLGGSAASNDSPAVGVQRLKALESENEVLRSKIAKLEARVAELELGTDSGGAKPKTTPAAKPDPASESDDDDDDLFGSDDEEEDAEAAKVREERLSAYAAKKSKKPGPIAKSSILLDIKPWDDETDMVEMEKCVRTIEMDGLLWGQAKLIPLAYGIKKLQINCVVEDDKVGTDDLEEKITAFENYVQSMDIAAFNKI